MKETIFKPAIWHSNLCDLQQAIHSIESDRDKKNSGDALVGLLTFDDGLSLVLDIPYGTIVDKKYIELGNNAWRYAGEFEDINTVFGFSQNGKWYVLKDIYISRYTKSYPGFSTQKIEGHSLTVSNKPISDDPTVDKIDLQLDGFTKWFRNFNITRKHEINQGEKGDYSGCKRIVHEYEPPDPCTLYQNDDISIAVEQTGVEAGGPVINPETSLSVTSRLVISYTKPIVLEEAIQTLVHQLRKLISLLSGAFCSIEEIQAYSLNENLNIEYYAPFIRRRHVITNDEVMHMPFSFPDVEEKLDVVIERWLNLSSDVANAATIIVSRLDGNVMPCDLTFIACASAFEALSRVGVNQERFTQQKFEACRNEALEAISDDEFRDWLKRIVYNRRSANSLAKMLLMKLQPFSSYLLPNTNKFLRDHRVCRNAYVHRDGLESDGVLKDEDLYIHAKAVWLLCYAAILDLIGIKPEECLEALKKSRYQDGVISRIRNQYEK